MKDGSYYMNANIDGVTYKGVFFRQQDESKKTSKVMTFTAVGSNNQCIWGSKLDLKDNEAVEYVAETMGSTILSSTKTNIILPTNGAYGTTISWDTDSPSVLNNQGVVNRDQQDVNVTLTAKVTKGKESYTKTFNVLVEGKLDKISVAPIYKYGFNSLSGTDGIINSGSKGGEATLVGTAAISDDQSRGKVLNIKNDKGAVKVNYLALPSDTFSGITEKGYTVSMWINVDSTDPNYFEHSALFEANGGDKYPVTRISANLFSRINANGAFADATEISKPLSANTWEYVTYTVSSKGIFVYVNGNEVSRAEKDITACFANDFLSNMTDVRVGSGNIWGDADIASAKFDNVSIYNTALSGQEVEALYNEEIASK